MDSPSHAVEDKSSSVILMFLYLLCGNAEVDCGNSVGRALIWCKVCSVFCVLEIAFQFLQENASRYVTPFSLGNQCSLNFFNKLLIVISIEALHVRCIEGVS